MHYQLFLATILPFCVTALPAEIQIDISVLEEQRGESYSDVYPHPRPVAPSTLLDPLSEKTVGRGADIVKYNFDDLEIGDIFEPIKIGPFTITSGSILDLSVFPNIAKELGRKKAWVTADDPSLSLIIPSKDVDSFALYTGLVLLDDKSEAYFEGSSITGDVALYEFDFILKLRRPAIDPGLWYLEKTFAKYKAANITFAPFGGGEIESGGFGFVSELQDIHPHEYDPHVLDAWKDVL